MRAEMVGMDGEELRAYGAANSKIFVQNQAPGSNMLLSERKKKNSADS
jgi:hypothetical protein